MTSLAALRPAPVTPQAPATPQILPPPPGPGSELAKTPPNYFRTYDELKSALQGLERTYPGLVEVRDIGDSAEKVAGIADRDILALVLTNKKSEGPKPSTLHVAGVHAREIANPELLMTYAQGLLEGYGHDADATMFLDNREIVLVPMANPDGHAVVERGFAGASDGNTMQRKSTMGGDARLGTDLNRNFDHHWGGPGASASPRSETYRGPAAASEPETQALQGYIEAARPDFFVDWHSYSRLNMYPWGDTREPTKDHAAFQALANKFSSYNDYTPIQAISLYPTTGTTDDFAYARTGKASMAVETGSSFLQSDAEFQRTVRENLPVLTYTARVADAPFERVFGPDVLDVKVDPATGIVSARLSDAQNGAKLITAAELVTSPTAEPGSGVALRPADGAWDSPEELVQGAKTKVGRLLKTAEAGQLVYVRGRDADKNWGPLMPQWLDAPLAGSATGSGA